MTVFLVHCNACLVCFYQISFFAVQRWEARREKSTEALKTRSGWLDGIKASAFKNRLLSYYYSLPESCLNEWFQMEIHWQKKKKNCTLSSFVMFTAAWTDSTGRNQQLCDLISAFTVYNIVQCVWKKANSLEYCAMSPVLLLWNVTVQFDLCILKIHSFLLLYIYMCPCMFVQKKKANVYFLYLSLHVLIWLNVSLLLCPCLISKSAVFNFLIECVCVYSD